MKKTKIIIIFILWIVFGILVSKVNYQIKQTQNPVTQKTSLNIDTLIQSISSSIDTDAFRFNDKKYDRFEDIFDTLEENYYDQEKLQSWAMIQTAVKAFVNAIDDPYTVYMDAEQNSGFQEQLKGEDDFEWIWAVVTKKDYYVLIEEIIKWSPAYNAGLLALDRIVAVDKDLVKDLNINEAVAKIKGPKWTKVTLSIERIDRRSNNKEFLDIEVIRDKLKIPSVSTKILEWDSGKKFWYINISIIWEETEKILKQEIPELKEQNVEWIILDLRWNGGGFMPIAVKVASHFIPKNELVVTAKYKSFADEEYLSEGYWDFELMPIVVIVDHITASAGEIISLALQEQVNAKIVGTTTFGKWSIQTLQEYEDDASLKYTIGKRYSPSGKNIDKDGMTPDIEIEFDADRYLEDRTDNQLEKAKEVLVNMIEN